jgi:uncharacterized coiled-coil DUF342 family protein
MDAEKISKQVKDYSKGGVTAGIAIFFLIQMNTKMDNQADEIKEMTNKQSEMNAVVVQLRSDVTNLWSKYNEAMKGKEALSKEGSQAYFEIMNRISAIERDCGK